MLFLVNLVAASGNLEAPQSDTSSTDYRDITDVFSVQEFEDATNFILKNGDRQTYCSMYGNNPHYSFDGFEAYLNPEIGQRNVGCDPEISGFNEITFRDPSADPQYYYVRIVRKGDSENEWIYIPKGMAEEKVYLYRYNSGDNLDTMERDVVRYIATLKREIATGVSLLAGQPPAGPFDFIEHEKGQCITNLPSKNAGEARVGIFDFKGRLILRRIILHHGDVSYHTDIRKLNLPKGFYTGRLIHNDQSISITFKGVSP